MAGEDCFAIINIGRKITHSLNCTFFKLCVIFLLDNLVYIINYFIFAIHKRGYAPHKPNYQLLKLSNYGKNSLNRGAELGAHHLND